MRQRLLVPATHLLLVSLAIAFAPGVVAASSGDVNTEPLYNLVEVATTVARILGPFFIAAGAVAWGVEKVSLSANKGLKVIVAGILMTALAFGLPVLIGLIRFVAEGV
jgi:hypothetical protein